MSSTDQERFLADVFAYHQAQLGDQSFPYRMDVAELSVSPKSRFIHDRKGHIIGYYYVDTPLSLPGLEYPVVKHLTLMGDVDFVVVSHELQRLGEKVLVITESYNQRVTILLDAMGAESTYYCQVKLMRLGEQLCTLECPPSAGVVLSTFIPGQDEILYADLYNRCLGYLGNLINEDFVQGLEERSSFDPDGYFLVKSESGGGLLAIEKEPWGPAGTGFGYIFQIGLTDDLKGQGVGRFLLNKALVFAGDHGIERIGVGVRKSNVNAIDFFEREGFVEVYRESGYLLDFEEAVL